MRSPTKFAYIWLALVATGLTVLPNERPALAAAPLLSSSLPADNATGVDINFDLTLTFDQAVTAGTGTILLKTSAGVTAESWDIATTSDISGYGTTVITLNRSVALSANTSYYFTIPNGGFKNSSNENYTGFSSTTALNFTTLAVPICTVTITGTSRPGNTLTANPSCSNSPTSYTYQWKRAGSDISGQTNSSYEVQFDDVGSSITVSISGLNSSGLGNTATSSGLTTYFAVERFVGTGTAGTSNGTSRLDATITDPTRLAVDSDDNVYICVSGFKILKVSTDGTVSTFVGTGSSGNTDGTGTAASISGCSDLKFGKDGYLYLNFGGSPIRKISTSGVVTSLQNAAGSVFNSAGSGSILSDSSGNIYIARGSAGGTNSGYLIRYNVVPCDGGVSGICHGPLTELGRISGAMNRAFFSSTGKIIVKDSYSTYNFHITDTLDTTGTSQTFSLFAVSNSINPNAFSISIDGSDNMYWGNSMGQYRLFASAFTSCPSPCTAVTPPLITTSADFDALVSGSGTNSASDSVFDSRGYLYVSQTASDVVFRIRTGTGGAPDATPPTATWTPPSTPSSSRTLSYTLAFSESVSGIAAGDFNNDAGTATGCVFTPNTSSGTSITVSVTCSSDGTVVARLAAIAVSDAAGNTGPTSNADASSVTIDTSAPTTTAATTTTVAPAPSPTVDTTTTTTTSTTSTTTTTSTTVPDGVVGINSWTIESSRNPVPPGSRIVLTTTISCGRQMSTTSRPYYPSMYYLVNSPQRINGVYGRPTLSSDRRTATFTVTVTAPTRSGTYQMYAYGRDNPFGGTCTGDSYNFASSSVFSLTVGSEETTTTTATTPETESTTTTILVMPTITTSTSSTTTTSSTTSTSTSSSTSTSITIELPTTSNPAPVVQLDITAEILLPEDSTDFVVTRESLIAIVDNLKITNGIIRVKTSDGDWRQFDIQNINDVVVPLGVNSSSLEIEVLEEGSSTPVAYSVPISSKSGSVLWPTQVLIFAAGLGTLWFFIFAIKRRRKSEPEQQIA